MNEEIARSIAVGSLTSLVTMLVCIVIAWVALQQVKFDRILKEPKSFAARLLQILLAVALGYEVGRFFTDYISWSSGLKGFF
ncbi:DUF1146 family protein [Gorillibacterium timonense]|uniref:DUF1146 family protein n=1 Tax=Gorillibacterium timonense TaxID=1689269 RepID=UPI001F3A3314|nr:DUF1146 family protein [Gorillibacterium timonense]